VKTAAEGHTVILDTLHGRWKGKSPEAYSAANSTFSTPGFPQRRDRHENGLSGSGKWKKENFPVFAPYVSRSYRQGVADGHGLDRSFASRCTASPSAIKKQKYSSDRCEQGCASITLFKVTTVTNKEGETRERERRKPDTTAADSVFRARSKFAYSPRLILGGRFWVMRHGPREDYGAESQDVHSPKNCAPKSRTVAETDAKALPQSILHNTPFAGEPCIADCTVVTISTCTFILFGGFRHLGKIKSENFCAVFHRLPPGFRMTFPDCLSVEEGQGKHCRRKLLISNDKQAVFIKMSS